MARLVCYLARSPVNTKGPSQKKALSAFLDRSYSVSLLRAKAHETPVPILCILRRICEKQYCDLIHASITCTIALHQCDPAPALARFLCILLRPPQLRFATLLRRRRLSSEQIRHSKSTGL